MAGRRRRRLAFRYAMRRVFLVIIMLFIIAVPTWLFIAKPQIDWPFIKDNGEAAPSASEEASTEPQSFDEEPGPNSVSEPETVEDDETKEVEDMPDAEDTSDISDASYTSDTGDTGDTEGWALILVNGENFLPENYEAGLELEAVTESFSVDKRIAENVASMFADAKSSGIALSIVSAYRSVEKQTALFDEKVAEYLVAGQSEDEAQAVAATIVAKPGTSEHHTGLAIDILTPSYTVLDEGFVDTPAFKWLSENAHKYGFVLRYPKDKQEITGIIYEPWHYRFVGEKTAADMKRRGLCLEEYLGQINKT